MGAPAERQPGQGPRRLPEVQLEEEHVAQVFEELEAKRDQWAQVLDKGRDDFKTSLLGGAWTAAHKGVVCDTVKASASGAMARSWCQQYGLPKTISFSLQKHGEQAAGALGNLWCRRMQALFDVYLASPREH